MHSEAVAAFRSTAYQVAADIVRAHERYDGVGRALLGYAPQLRDAQAESVAALRQAQYAEAELVAANRQAEAAQARVTAAAPGAEATIAAGDHRRASATAEAAGDALVAARRRLQQAVDARDMAAQRALRQVDDLIASADLNDDWWDNSGGKVVAAIAEGADRVAATTAYLAGVFAAVGSVSGRVALAALEGDDGDLSVGDVGHAVLDVAGLVPVAGEAFDGINAAWYTAEADYTNAALSAAAMVPIAGWAATGGKLGVRGVKAVRSVDGARAFVTGRPAMVPRAAKQVEFTPSPKFPVGERYEWVDPATGKRVQYHAHGPDPARSASDNAGQGPIYRKQFGSNHFADADGNLHTKNSLKPGSPAYNPQAANDTHISYPKDQPRPDQHHVRFAAPNPAGLTGQPDDEQR